MRKRVLWLAAPVALVSSRVLRRKRRKTKEGPDPRAGELRQRLDESREIVSEREEFEAGETPIDTVEDRRDSVHEHGREAIDKMRSDGS